MKKILIYFIFIFLTKSIFAQKEQINFNKISLEDGLSQSSVNCITQDSKGFMWFGTLDGLNKYNGYEITTFRNNLKEKSSLPDNAITSIFEDSRGLLWIGTLSKGIAIYDKLKNNFFPIQKQKKVNTLIGDQIKSILEDDDGNIWIASLSGLSKLTRSTNTFKFTNYTEKEGLLSNKINFLLKDKLGNIWIASDKGLCSFNIKNNTFTDHTVLHPASNVTIKTKINTLCFDQQNILWLGMETGLVKYYKSTAIARKFEEPQTSNNSIARNKITALLNDNEGILWVGTAKNGLFKFTDKTNKLLNFKHDASNNKSISINEILSIYQDDSGILWIGTSLGGINKWNKLIENIKVYKHNSYDKNSISSNLVRTIYQDKDETVWIGTVDGGLNKWEKENEKFITFKHSRSNKSTISNNNIRAIFEDSKSRLWIGTDGGGLNLLDRETGKFKHFKNNKNDKNSLNNNRVWGLYEEGENLLIATFGGGVNLFNYEKKTFISFRNDSSKVNSLSDDRVTCIYKDKVGNYWIGTYGGGLNLYRPDSKDFKIFRFDKKNENSLGNDRVYSIFEDSNNNLWIGTKGSLNKYNPLEKTFTRFNENDGFPNDVMMGILEDEDENLWISTNKGISKFNIESKSIRNYDVNDGLQGNEFLVGSYFKNNKGEMLFGGINGFNTFKPSALKSNTNIPRIVITSFKILNKEASLDSAISEKKHIKLNWKSNNITFEFVALDYIFPQKNQYAYKLEGFEEEWNYIKNKRYASYTNLPKGKYTFRVKGTNNEGQWNTVGTKIKITIRAALWQMVWFQILILIFILIIILLIVKIRLKLIKLRENELERLVTVRTKDIFLQKKKIKEQLANIAFQKQEITDSLIYAKKIHLNTSVTNSKFIEKQTLKEYFVFSKAKDKISNDFYWIRRTENKMIFAILDSDSSFKTKLLTNKIASSFLNNIVNNREIKEPNVILTNLVENISTALQKNTIEVKDVKKIEIAVCVIDLEKRELQFSGSATPLYFIRNKKLSIIEGNSKSICFSDDTSNLNFKTSKLKLLAGDIFYLFSDGYAKQLGEKSKTEFMYRRFRDLLLTIHTDSMENQKNILNKTMNKWKRKNKLDDDILVIGFSI